MSLRQNEQSDTIQTEAPLRAPRIWERFLIQITYGKIIGFHLLFSLAALTASAAVENTPRESKKFESHTDLGNSRALQQANLVVQKQKSSVAKAAGPVPTSGTSSNTPSRGYWMGTHVVTRHKKELSLKTGQ